MNEYKPNSMHARDIAAMVHPQTNIKRHEEVGPMVITRGKGIYIYEDSGKEYLEAASGLWCASLGFGNERLAKVAYDAIKNVGFYHTFRHASNPAAIELCERLIDIAPADMSKVLLQCSGSEANDTAVKLVWYYWDSQGKPEKRKIISRDMAYHGTTTIGVCLTGKPEFHAGFGLPFPGFLKTNFPHYYRYGLENETEEAFSTRMAKSLEDLIIEEGPETIGAFWAEPVMGGGGALTPPAGYFEKIQAVLKKYDILFVADEVICGFGRTGQMWGSQTYNLQPDMICCAKALSAAMQPISALLINERIYQGMREQSIKRSHFVHGFTYAGHPAAAAVANETLKIYEEMDLVGKVTGIEPQFLSAMKALESHPLVGTTCGVGLLGGVELVLDKGTKELHPTSSGLAVKIEKHSRKHSIILRQVNNRIAISPPLIIKPEELTDMFDRMTATFDDTYAELN